MLGVRPVVTCVALAALAACQREPEASTPAAIPATSALSRQRVQTLRGRESTLRSRYLPREAPPWLDVSGADPYRLLALPDQRPGFVGILRGSKAFVTLDAELNELARVDLAEAPTALCLSRGAALVGSRFSPYITRVDLGASSSPMPLGTQRVPATGVADLACDQGELLYALTTDEPELVTLDTSGKVRDRRPAMPGGLRLLKRGRYLLESSLFERSLRVLELSRAGVPTRELARIRHDGPIWAFDALERGSELLIAVAGVEDKPLVRAHGEFENIDSFVWLYRYAGAVEPLLALDVGEQGLVVPKAVGLSEHDGQLLLSVLAAGSGRLLRARFERDLSAAPRLELENTPPGASDAVFIDTGAVAYPSPLLDAWVKSERRSIALRHVDPQRRPEPQVRLGEALFFTSLIAPQNVSTGSHSRFSCETCHFEGGVDGRTHYTGRGEVSVVTKPLFGLANNRPHFSRALDRDLSSVSHNEFRVAGAGSGTDPWFNVESARFPWLHELGIERGQLSALDLREALIAFLYAFSHDPNPRVLARTAFSELEQQGARLFAERCESCHTARLFSDDASSHAPFAEWQELVLRRNAPLVWARSDYEKTGILPYVHERGTRITSLRRLALKPRYFTNGSAATLGDVLTRFRFGNAGALHESPTAAAGLSALDEPAQRALLAFLRLL